MGKYNELHITRDEVAEIGILLDVLTDLSDRLTDVSLDHVQVGDSNGDVLGKVQFADGTWRFHARKHDKPAVLGE